MNAAAIIAEYNPFHNGHAYHIEQTRKSGYTHIAAIMSGDFVQRGSIAIADKFHRAQAAVLGGIDLVLEMPMPWCMSAAENYAKAGIAIADAMHIFSALSFGCETNNPQLFDKAVHILQSKIFNEKLQLHLRSGISYPQAITETLNDTGEGDISLLLQKPNNMLVLSYLQALKKTAIAPFYVQRRGCEHDSSAYDEQNASASAIREKIYKLYMGNMNDSLVSLPMPCEVNKLYKQLFNDNKLQVMQNKFDIASLSRLQVCTVKDFTDIPDTLSGYEYKLYKSLFNCYSFSDVCLQAKSKCLTLARVRRMYLQAMFGITKTMMYSDVPYIRVLAFNERGRELLREAKIKSDIPIVMRYSDIKNLNKFAKDIFQLNSSARDFFELCLPNPSGMGMEAKSEIFHLK